MKIQIEIKLLTIATILIQPYFLPHCFFFVSFLLYFPPNIILFIIEQTSNYYEVSYYMVKYVNLQLTSPSKSSSSSIASVFASVSPKLSASSASNLLSFKSFRVSRSICLKALLMVIFLVVDRFI